MSKNFNSDRNFQSYSNMQPFQTSSFQEQGPPFRTNSPRPFGYQHSNQNIPQQRHGNANMQMGNYQNNSCSQNPNFFNLTNQPSQMGNYFRNPNSMPNQIPERNIGPNPHSSFPFRSQNPQVMSPVRQVPFMNDVNASRFGHPPIPMQNLFNRPSMPIGNTQAPQPYSPNTCIPQTFVNPGSANIEQPRLNTPGHSSGNYWNDAHNLKGSGNFGGRPTLASEKCEGNSRVLKAIPAETDQEWIRCWASNVQERLDSEKRRKSLPKLKIIDIQRKLLRYATLVHGLETSLNNFNSMDSTDKEFVNFRNNAEVSKKEIIELGSYFEDDQNLARIKRMIARRRRKRLVARKAKKEKAERRKQLKKEWEEKEKRIDEKMKLLHELEKNKINEEKMKKEADAILREVRIKQDEAKRMQRILEVLTKLREARIKKGEMHGYVVTPQGNAFFEKLNDEFDRLLKDQLSIYNTEEQTLKVMMEESKTIYPHLKNTSHTKPKVEEVQRQIYEILFGKKGDENDFERSFTAADDSAEILVQRRSDWDKFLVAEEHSNGSAVPIPWVLPNENPQEDWKCFQQS